MKFFVNLKRYDTDRSEEICKGNYQISEKIQNKYTDITRFGTLYRTQKGSYFFAYTYDIGKWKIKLLSPTDAKIFIAETDYKKYVELFGEMEEG